ncbi:unnamed protein product [Urochloa humidicola]
MAGIGSSSSHPRSDSGAAMDDAGVADLMKKLNLTKDEGEVAMFSDDEDGEGDCKVQLRLLGKVLSPSALHISTIRSAMTKAWGNPYGLKMRSVGEMAENLFIADFGCLMDKQRALDGSPWIIGRHAVILREYDDSLKPSDVCFAKMEMWVRILNLPLGWMNERRGRRAAGLVGDVVKVDVDRDGDASGPFLRARVAIEVDKPLRRGVFLQTKRNAEPEWFDIQYEKLPFFCYSCGVMGHITQECPNPAPKNAIGKLPYDIKLRAPDEKKKRPLSFGQAAAESFGSSSGGERPTAPRQSQGSGKSASAAATAVDDEAEVVSPVKPKGSSHAKGSTAAKELFVEKEAKADNSQARKRKPRMSGGTTPDLNIRATDGALIPAGLVHERLNQLGKTSGRVGDGEEVPKKQKTANSKNARSAAAAGGSPRRAQ